MKSPSICVIKACEWVDAGRKEFPAFPFEPYSIQTNFMQALYKVLQQGGVGLFESPTGMSARKIAVV